VSSANVSSASVAELVAELESRFPDGEPPPGTVEHVVFLRHEVRLAAVRLEHARAKLRASIRSREGSRPPLTLIQGGRDDA
jgi:hypothetical protein